MKKHHFLQPLHLGKHLYSLRRYVSWDSDIIPKMIRRIIVDDWSNDEAIAEAEEALWQLYDDWQQRLEQ